MSQIAINTSQNVKINFELASVGERIFAFFIDMIIKISYLLGLYFILEKLFNIKAYISTLDDFSAMALIFFLSLPFYLYTLVLESLMEGQTFGKKLMKIKVVKIDGYQAGFSDYLIRWIFKLVDVFTNSGCVGIIAIVLSKYNQRLGDMASGTAVISLKNKVHISQTILENLKSDYIPRFPQVVALSDTDMQIIKKHYNDAKLQHDTMVLNGLANKIQETIKVTIKPEDFTPRTFIETVLKDYNYYTSKEV